MLVGDMPLANDAESWEVGPELIVCRQLAQALC